MHTLPAKIYNPTYALKTLMELQKPEEEGQEGWRESVDMQAEYNSIRSSASERHAMDAIQSSSALFNPPPAPQTS